MNADKLVSKRTLHHCSDAGESLATVRGVRGTRTVVTGEGKHGVLNWTGVPRLTEVPGPRSPVTDLEHNRLYTGSQTAPGCTLSCWPARKHSWAPAHSCAGHTAPVYPRPVILNPLLGAPLPLCIPTPLFVHPHLSHTVDNLINPRACLRRPSGSATYSSSACQAWAT